MICKRRSCLLSGQLLLFAYQKIKNNNRPVTSIDEAIADEREVSLCPNIHREYSEFESLPAGRSSIGSAVRESGRLPVIAR